MTAPGGPGETAGVYAVHAFGEGMTQLAKVFLQHPELKWIQATSNPDGHVDIIVNAGTGVLHSWIHALSPGAHRKQDLYSLQSGAAIEEIVIDGPLTVHVRPGGAR